MENKLFHLRSASSVCHFCFEIIQSSVIEKEGKIFLQKVCPSHGVINVLLSTSPRYYRELDKFYFEIMDEEKSISDAEIFITLKCNMTCSICYFRCNKNILQTSEPSCAEIERYVQKSKKTFFVISGGEPTCRDDLPEIIRIFKKYSKPVTLNTNGIRLADMDYSRSLKKAGLDRVSLQLDSFCVAIEQMLRGDNYLDVKMRALDNLRKLKLSTGINTVVIKGVNEHKLNEMVDFVAANNFIKTINFLTIATMGKAKNMLLDNYIMPDELVDLLDQQTNGKLAREKIYLFQKLHLALKSFFSQRFCFYCQSYIAVRTKSGYEPLDKFLNFNNMEKWLDRYREAYKKSRFKSFGYLFIAILTMFRKIKSFFIIKEIFLMSLSYFFRTSHYLKSPRFFYINFTTGCDFYKVDYRISRNCHNEIIWIDEKSNVLKNCGRASHFFTKREKELLRSKKEV